MPYYESLEDGPVQVELLPDAGAGLRKKYRVVKETETYSKGIILYLFPGYVWDTVRVVGHKYVYERKVKDAI